MSGSATSILLYAVVPRTRVLGPFSRYALWVQGCPFRCQGCMTPGAQGFDGGILVSTEALADDILGEKDIEGITVSGGEPFAQASALVTLVKYLRARRDLGVIAYSGYRLQELQERAHDDPSVSDLLAEIDLLIDGVYIAERNDGAALRGSANQKIWPLSDRYRSRLHAYSPEETRKVELHVGINERMLVGIPSARQLAWWQSRDRRPGASN